MLLKFKLQLSDNILIIPPQGYLSFMSLQQQSKFIITDSGSIQENLPSLVFLALQ